MTKNFSELTEQELLALAIALEEEDNRTYRDLAEAMRETYPGTARMFAAIADDLEDFGPSPPQLVRTF